MRFPLSALLLLALPAGPVSAAEPKSFTFLVGSDSHFGARGMEEQNRRLVEQMNALPGTEYPPEVGGQVEEPRGVLFLGDTTDNGLLEEFAQFEASYGLTGTDGLLRYPVFEAIGNHDVNSSSPIKERVKRRHGGINYSWEWEGVHFACLDMYPDSRTIDWLLQDLHRVGRERPLVLFFHYSLEGYYSDFWSQEDKDAFARAIEPFNVAAIFHGHEHRVGRYVWRGHEVFRPGAPRHSSHFFLVVRVRGSQMTVLSRDFDTRKWRDVWVVDVKR
jgi:cytolysin (calcineurin-like family phosphatase)